MSKIAGKEKNVNQNCKLLYIYNCKLLYNIYIYINAFILTSCSSYFSRISITYLHGAALCPNRDRLDKRGEKKNFWIDCIIYALNIHPSPRQLYMIACEEISCHCEGPKLALWTLPVVWINISVPWVSSNPLVEVVALVVGSLSHTASMFSVQLTLYRLHFVQAIQGRL